MPISDATRARDEAFWQGQEARRERKLGQPCCTQSGMSWTMIDVPGDFAVVIHGEFDCLNCFHHHIGRSAHQYYSTRLSEAQLTTGDTEETLAELLRLIAEHEQPEAILVLGTCPVEVIGAQYTTTVADVAKETGVPIVALRTSGLALSSQQQMLDWLYVTLAKMPPVDPPDRAWQREIARMALEAAFEPARSAQAQAQLHARLTAVRPPADGERVRVNLLGLPNVEGRVPEPVYLLDEAGISVNGAYPDGASLSEWRAIRHAEHTFAVNPSMYPKLARRLGTWDQAVHAVPLPVGVEATTRFYAAVGEATGRRQAVQEAIAPWKARATAATDTARVTLQGLRMGMAIRMMNTYRPERLAYEGLGELPLLQELGLDVTLLVQGPPDDDARAAFAERLSELGFGHVPFEVFAGPYQLADALRAGEYDLCAAADSSREAAVEAGIPMVATRGFPPFYEGVPAAAERLARAVRDARRNHA